MCITEAIIYRIIKKNMFQNLFGKGTLIHLHGKNVVQHSTGVSSFCEKIHLSIDRCQRVILCGLYPLSYPC